LIDLAGAERPDKAGGNTNRVNSCDVYVKLMTGKPLDISEQGFIINNELSGFDVEVTKCIE